MAANRLGVARMQAICAKYGVGAVLAACEALLDYAERKMRAGIATIPDGSYTFEDWHDNPEIDQRLRFTARIEVRGDEMHLHFKSPKQVRAGLNMTYTALPVDGLLRGQDGRRSDDPAQCRVGAAAARDRAGRYGVELRQPGGRQRAAGGVSAGRRPDPWGVGGSDPRAGDRGLQRFVRLGDLRG